MSHKFSECEEIHPNTGDFDCFYCQFKDIHVKDAPCYSCLLGKECEYINYIIEKCIYGFKHEKPIEFPEKL